MIEWPIAAGLATALRLYYIVLHVWPKAHAMGTLTIRIDEKLEKQLNQLAKSQHRTKSEVARDLLRRHLLLAEIDQIREKLRPYGEAAGFLTDEDFFSDIS